MAWLDDNRPARSQFRSPRRQRPSGVMVVHTAENTPDFVAFDGGAEAVARFIRDRSDPGSYHDLADSDSAIQLVDYGNEAYQDGTGSNPHAWGGSIATRADVWPLAPEAWRNGAIRQLARRAAVYARWARSEYGVVIPARRITRAQSERKVPGFISHAERDPGRRTDPGAGFPWTQFFAEYQRATGTAPTVPEEDDMPSAEEVVAEFAEELEAGQQTKLRRNMVSLLNGELDKRDWGTRPLLVQAEKGGPVYVLEGDRGGRWLVRGWDNVRALVAFYNVSADGEEAGHPKPWPIPQTVLDAIPETTAPTPPAS